MFQENGNKLFLVCVANSQNTMLYTSLPQKSHISRPSAKHLSNLPVSDRINIA